MGDHDLAFGAGEDLIPQVREKRGPEVEILERFLGFEPEISLRIERPSK